MRRKRYIVKTNFDTATPEQMDRLYQNAAEAYMWLYKNVVDRKAKEMFHKIYIN